MTLYKGGGEAVPLIFYHWDLILKTPGSLDQG